MPKRKVVTLPERQTYRVISEKVVGPILGPYKLVHQIGGHRTVMLTEQQARFYVDQGLIEQVI